MNIKLKYDTNYQKILNNQQNDKNSIFSLSNDGMVLNISKKNQVHSTYIMCGILFL